MYVYVGVSLCACLCWVFQGLSNVHIGSLIPPGGVLGALFCENQLCINLLVCLYELVPVCVVLVSGQPSWWIGCLVGELVASEFLQCVKSSKRDRHA